MKKGIYRYTYLVLIISCSSFAFYIYNKGKNTVQLPQLKDRNAELSLAADWPIVQKTTAQLLTEIKKKPGQNKLYLALAKEYLQEGRVSGNFSYYNEASLELIDHVLKIEPKNLDALCLKGTVLMSQHRFEECKQLMEGVALENSYNAYVFGLLTDAHLELGNYNEAILMADKMVGLRPDLRSYSRISYLRELHGDLPGAIEAIQLAISAGYPGGEETEWARMILAHLYENSGDLIHAEEQYRMALEERPNYPFALSGLGKIAKAKGILNQAIQFQLDAIKIMADASFFEELVELYSLNQELDKMNEYAQLTINSLKKDNQIAYKDQKKGHFSDRELAKLYLSIKDYKNALEYSKRDYERRPMNIESCEILAWSYYNLGQFSELKPLIEKAMRTNYKNPEFLARIGIMQNAIGNQSLGLELIKSAFAKKPYLDIELEDAIWML